MLNLRSPARDGNGFSLATDATFARGLAGDPSRHATFSAEGVGALGVDDRTFLLRARVVMVERLSSAPIPFEELFIPSGLYDMRGFATGRLRGDSGLVGSVSGLPFRSIIHPTGIVSPRCALVLTFPYAATVVAISALPLL